MADHEGEDDLWSLTSETYERARTELRRLLDGQLLADLDAIHDRARSTIQAGTTVERLSSREKTTLRRIAIVLRDRNAGPPFAGLPLREVEIYVLMAAANEPGHPLSAKSG